MSSKHVGKLYKCAENQDTLAMRTAPDLCVVLGPIYILC